jgi:hypothetical protein
VLETHPKADLRVYAVWFNMMANDSRAKWRETLLSDRRVTHFWDEPKIVGTWFAPRTAAMAGRLSPDGKWGDGDVLWDAYLLYGTDARWDAEPTGLLSWGRTIMASKATLESTIDRLF